MVRIGHSLTAKQVTRVIAVASGPSWPMPRLLAARGRK